MVNKLDDLLNRITMYRLMLYGLVWLVAVTFCLSLTGSLHFPPIDLAISLGVLLTAGFIVKFVFAKLYRIEPNFESSLITTLLLFFILFPADSVNLWLGLVVAIVVALASKYIINWRGAHIFNPAAFGALVASLTGLASAGWWVASPVLLPFVAIFGLLILRKTRQFLLFAVFALVATGLLLLHGIPLQTIIFSYPLVFLGTLMLTEPATVPTSLRWRLVYGAIVGVVFGAVLNLGFVSTSPHLALLVGNLFAFFVSVRTGQLLKLVEKRRLSPTSYEFSFAGNTRIGFKPGQYFNWTLGGVKFDSRGNRRSFTIASSPLEKDFKIGVKFYEPSSQFKKTLLNLKKGDQIHASGLSGEFVLPKDTGKKLLFIAGGIGVTPFRSMVKDLVLRKERRDIILFYFAASEQEVLYKDIWQEAKQYGVRVVPFTNSQKLGGALLQKYSLDFKQRDFYLSGPPSMVRAYTKVLSNLNISLRQIRTDYFSGY